jgi:hypothetical protein
VLFRSYLAALAAVETGESLGELAEQLCRPVIWHGERRRALNPYSPEDASLLETVNRGEFAINGFRNRDLRALLYPKSAIALEAARCSAKITRQLRLLRAHGLIKKVAHTHRYQLTTKGRRAITALLTARNSDVKKLTNMAA